MYLNFRLLSLAEVTQLSCSSAMDNSVQMIRNVLSSIEFHCISFIYIRLGIFFYSSTVT